MQAWIKENKLNVTGYSTQFQVGHTRIPMANEEYGALHQLMLQEYEKGLRRLMLQPTFDAAPDRIKQERVKNVLEVARLRARAAFRKQLGSK